MEPSPSTRKVFQHLDAWMLTKSTQNVKLSSSTDTQEAKCHHNTVDGIERMQTFLVKCLKFLAKVVDAFQKKSITVK